MFNVIFVYPHPDFFRDIVVTTFADSRIHHLWELANARKPSLAAHIGNKECIFYIPSDLSFSPSDTLLSRSQDWLRRHRDDGKQVRSADLTSNVFPQAPHIRMVHVLVVTEELLEGLDYMGDLPRLAHKRRGNSIKTFRSSFPTPSEGVKNAAGVNEVVNRNRNKFHAGRPEGNFGPPVSLFNHALGLFDHALSHLDDGSSLVDLHPSLLHLAHSFLDVAVNHYTNEAMRMEVIKGILSQIFPPMDWAVARTRFGIQPNAINANGTPFFVVELKNEAGIEGDASLQAALSYAHMVTSPIDNNSQLLSRYPTTLSNCPAVLYGIMGNLFEIGVAMYTDGLYSNLLFSERLVSDFHVAKNVLRLARAFAATQRVLDDLSQFYSAAPPAGSIVHFFPSPLPVPTYTAPMPSLAFTHRLSPLGEAVILAEDEITRQSRLYLANMARSRSIDEGEDTVMSSSVDTAPDTLEVIVKFTAQYNPKAHRLLATEGFAPVLHACVPVCSGLYMVVMDRVQGEMAWHVTNRGEHLAYDVYKDIRDAIALLHSNDFVFGDLRTPNIMVVTRGSGSDAQYHGMLIDFDWVGIHGIGRYPPSLNELQPDFESSGVLRYGIMEKAHDLVMLTKLERRCRSV